MRNTMHNLASGVEMLSKTNLSTATLLEWSDSPRGKRPAYLLQLKTKAGLLIIDTRKGVVMADGDQYPVAITTTDVLCVVELPTGTLTINRTSSSVTFKPIKPTPR